MPVNVSRSGPYDLFGTQANVTLPALSSNADTATTNISPVIAKRRIGLKSLPMLQPR